MAGLVDCAEPVEPWLIAPVEPEALGLVDVLGLDDVSVPVDGLVEALELVDPLGLDVEEEPSLPVTEDDVAPPCPCTPSAASVCWSRLPDCGSPCDCWKLRSALCVCGPIWPSIAPASKPLSFSACCAERTSDASWLADEAVASLDDVDEFWLLEEAADGLWLDIAPDWLPLADVPACVE